jgi:hypothetical protein
MTTTDLPPVSNKQLEIFNLLYKFRFLNTNQIQKLMNHKNPQGIQEWLKDLTKKGYIKQWYSTKTYADKMTPAIYSLTKLSRKKLKANEEYEISVLNRIYGDKDASQIFIDHNLLIADIFLILFEENQDKLKFFTQANLVGYDYLPNKRQLDAYIAIKDSNKKTRRFFLKIFDTGVPRYALRALINQYFEYADGDDWRENTINTPFPKILLVCADENMKKFLFKFIKNRLEEERCEIFFYLTKRETIKSYRDKDEIWQKVE